MSEPITILIAEDQRLMRTALTALLDLEPDLTVIGGVEHGDEVVAAARRLRPDVVLLDIELPGRSGLDLIVPLRTAVPDCSVIVVTTFGRPGYLARALGAGARGFLLKDDPVERLADAIRRVRDGERVVDPDLAADALAAAENPLTGRETDVLRASASGATVDEIALQFSLSPSTVRNYLSNAIGKLGAQNRLAAFTAARDHGWL
ncbi:response regulator transcription factor [Agromyces sp. G08B096]|uniref:Response regulator transcription factor n=1 Tax=Agromyces sp. G08B096 TaxID=3156399 RepID=A0AAU7W2R8_9MICO